VLIEVIDGQSFSLGPVTHETKPLDVTIGSHTNKVVFNVISSLRNLVVIGLSWLVLYNPQVDWHTRIFTLKHHNMKPWSVKPS
jgi:hypothetical protein